MCSNYNVYHKRPLIVVPKDSELYRILITHYYTSKGNRKRYYGECCYEFKEVIGYTLDCSYPFDIQFSTYKLIFGLNFGKSIMLCDQTEKLLSDSEVNDKTVSTLNRDGNGFSAIFLLSENADLTEKLKLRFPKQAPYIKMATNIGSLKRAIQHIDWIDRKLFYSK